MRLADRHTYTDKYFNRQTDRLTERQPEYIGFLHEPCRQTYHIYRQTIQQTHITARQTDYLRDIRLVQL